MKIYNKLNLPKHVVQHSPDGFAWGYGGSGPAELARCLLLEVVGQDQGEGWHYQDFKSEFVAGWNDSWAISDEDIREWVRIKSLPKDQEQLERAKIYARSAVKSIELAIKRQKEGSAANWTATISYA